MRLITLFSVLAFGCVAHGVTGHTLLGLAEIPRVIAAEESGKLTSNSFVRLYASPTYGSQVSAVAKHVNDFDHREFSFERDGAAVYAQSGKWLYVGLAGGEGGWLAPDDVGAFHSLADLLKNDVYMTSDWDGNYWKDPEARPQDPSVFAHRGTERINYIKADVNVLDHKMIKDKLWFKVEILGPGRCTERKPAKLETGWIPAENSEHKLNFWFSTRGC